jgi:hypothetical protein
MEHNFALYATPKLSSLYSAEYFGNITFRQTMELDYAVIAPRGSVLQWTFDYEEHHYSRATDIMVDEVIPHLDDLQPICQDIENVFRDGYRSVVVVLVVDNMTIDYYYNFSKVSFRLLDHLIMACLQHHH